MTPTQSRASQAQADYFEALRVLRLTRAAHEQWQKRVAAEERQLARESRFKLATGKPACLFCHGKYGTWRAVLRHTLADHESRAENRLAARFGSRIVRAQAADPTRLTEEQAAAVVECMQPMPRVRPLAVAA